MKTIFKIAAAMILIGGVLAFIGFAMGGFKADAYSDFIMSDEDFTLIEQASAGEVNKLVLACDSNDLNFTESEDENFHFTYYVAENYTVTYTESEGVITVIAKVKFSWKFLMFNYVPEKFQAMEIAVPTAFAGEISADVSSGNIVLAGMNLSSLSIEMSSGDVSVSDTTVAGAVSFRTSSGDINLNNCTAGGAVTMNSSSGEINSNALTAPELSIEVSSGAVSVTALTCPDVDAEISSGDTSIEILGDYDEYRVDVRASSGDITVEGMKIIGQTIHESASKSVNVRCSSGDIDIMFRLP